MPGDDEIAGRVEGNGRESLVVGGVAVDAELVAGGCASIGVALGVDGVVAGIAAAGTVALPDNHKVTIVVHSDRGEGLAAFGVGVDL